MPKRGGDLFLFFYIYIFTVISCRTWSRVTNILEKKKKAKLSYEQGSHFVFFINTFSSPPAFFPCTSFALYSFQWQWCSALQGQECPSLTSLYWDMEHNSTIPCPGADTTEHWDRWHGDAAPGSSSNCHPKDWHSWTPVPIIILGSFSITWKSYLLDPSPDLCTSWDVS